METPASILPRADLTTIQNTRGRGEFVRPGTFVFPWLEITRFEVREVGLGRRKAFGRLFDEI